MSLVVVCGKCGRRFRAKDEFAGKQFRCPSCRAVGQVPFRAGASPPLDRPSGADGNKKIKGWFVFHSTDPLVTSTHASVDGKELDITPSRKLLNYSRVDFTWGYSGQGSRQLALAILLEVSGDATTALAHYVDFTDEFVAHWGNWDRAWDGFEAEADVLGWLRKKAKSKRKS